MGTSRLEIAEATTAREMARPSVNLLKVFRLEAEYPKRKKETTIKQVRNEQNKQKKTQR